MAASRSVLTAYINFVPKYDTNNNTDKYKSNTKIVNRTENEI